MKQTLFLLICICITSFYAKADNYKPQQKTFRNDIQSYLKEEGYVPTINTNTGDINFKIEGNNYSIEMDTEYNGPYLVSINTGFSMDEMTDIELQKLYVIENEINSNYDCVKCYFQVYEDLRLLSFSVESFCYSSEEFKYALAKYIKLMKSAVTKFVELFSSNQLPSNNTSNPNISQPHKIAVNSSKIETQYHSWVVVSVELFPDRTLVHKRVYPKTKETWINSDTSEYIEDSSTGKKYYLKSSSIGNRTVLHSQDPYDFTETYPALPESVHYINISSGSQYYIRNLKCR